MGITLRFLAAFMVCLVAGNLPLAAKSFNAHFFLLHNKTQVFGYQVFNKIKEFKSEKFSCLSIVNSYRNSKVISSKKTLNANETIVIRTAIIASPQYSNYFLEKYSATNKNSSYKIALIKEELQKAVDEVNLVAFRDLNIRLELVSDIDKLIFVQPNAFFEDIDNHNDALNIAEDIITKTLDHDSYDLGHIFTTKQGGASGKSTAFGVNKWQGSTGSVTPEGSKFYLNYFAHEIGHQLGATHTQNADCARSYNSSVEINSGISIMSYAGVCYQKDSNVGSNSAPFYHVFSIEQIKKHLGLYFTRDNQENKVTISKIPDYYIPIGTPFEIKINTKTSQKDILYNCEQIDNDSKSQEDIKYSETGPSFISPKLSSENVISFPPLLDVINNQLYNEFNSLSEIPRSYSFAASARLMDNFGQYLDVDKFSVHTIGNTSFEVTSQKEKDINWESGNTYKITWNSDTSNSPLINCTNVDISLSLDGLSFDYAIVENTPNDGEFEFEIPENLQCDYCRIKIKAVDNIFYAINEASFSINKNETSTFSSLEFGTTESNNLSIYVNKEFQEKELAVNINLASGIYENLDIKLIRPDEKVYELINQACQTYIEQSDATFYSAWQTSNKNVYEYNLCPTSITGNYPFKTSNTANNTYGNWKLIVSNNGNATPEKVISWSIEFLGKGSKSLSTITQNVKNDKTLLYPNPTKDILWLENSVFSETSTSVIISNKEGQLVSEFSFTSVEKKSINLSHLPKGIYFVHLSNNNLSEIHKIIIK